MDTHEQVMDQAFQEVSLAYEQYGCLWAMEDVERSNPKIMEAIRSIEDKITFSMPISEMKDLLVRWKANWLKMFARHSSLSRRRDKLISDAKDFRVQKIVNATQENLF